MKKVRGPSFLSHKASGRYMTYISLSVQGVAGRSGRGTWEEVISRLANYFPSPLREKAPLHEMVESCVTVTRDARRQIRQGLRLPAEAKENKSSDTRNAFFQAARPQAASFRWHPFPTRPNCPNAVWPKDMRPACATVRLPNDQAHTIRLRRPQPDITAFYKQVYCYRKVCVSQMYI